MLETVGGGDMHVGGDGPCGGAGGRKGRSESHLDRMMKGACMQAEPLRRNNAALYAMLRI